MNFYYIVVNAREFEILAGFKNLCDAYRFLQQQPRLHHVVIVSFYGKVYDPCGSKMRRDRLGWTSACFHDTLNVLFDSSQILQIKRVFGDGWVEEDLDHHEENAIS